jgi:hypothetical protein
VDEKRFTAVEGRVDAIDKVVVAEKKRNMKAS